MTVMSGVLFVLACLGAFVLVWEGIGRLAGTRGGAAAAVLYLGVSFAVAGAVWMIQAALSTL